MNLDTWLQAAIADAQQRGLPELKALLEALASSTRALRGAGYLEPAHGRRGDGGGDPANR
jgi:hypothetical protein